jgi:hypothetical protein
VTREIASGALDEGYHYTQYFYGRAQVRTEAGGRIGIRGSPLHLLGREHALVLAIHLCQRYGHRLLVDELPFVDVHHVLVGLVAFLVYRSERVDIAAVKLGDGGFDCRGPRHKGSHL